MYKLLPKQYWLAGLAIFALFNAAALWVVDQFNFSMNDWRVATVSASAAALVFAFLFGGTGWWSPWRVCWRVVPFLNTKLFPDLNGIWVGSTRSNWPTIKNMLDAAQTDNKITRDELHDTPEQVDAMAIEIKASLFYVKITGGLSSTNGQSHSITVRPWKNDHDHLHLTYIYKQETPNPVVTDDETHLGAADLVIDMENIDKAEGVYWTRRNWKMGLNTAGRLQLRRIRSRKEEGKCLRQYANEEKTRMVE
uniref:Cap15 family cyclic dinucleotide receptor domain-containing protein n=1 Tax=Pararhizobium sp. IMCC3301 TaxID=3067904 RepID=UPI00274197FB|nr:hypothetical protein [Pararhizobium sp. IMCC3301]